MSDTGYCVPLVNLIFVYACQSASARDIHVVEI
jgi:hypothetical protein